MTYLRKYDIAIQPNGTKVISGYFINFINLFLKTSIDKQQRDL